MYTWPGVPTCRDRACPDRSLRSVRVQKHTCLPWGRLRLLRVGFSTRVVRVVVFKHYPCTVVHTCGSSARAVVVIVAPVFSLCTVPGTH